MFYNHKWIDFNLGGLDSDILFIIIIVIIIGLLVMTVGMKKLGFRVVVAIGGGLNAIGYLITGFAKNIGVFYFSQGVLAGTFNIYLHYKGIKKNVNIFMARSSILGCFCLPYQGVYFKEEANSFLLD